MYYFVIGADGGRYGPADIDTLVQWTKEGRLIGSTRLIERGTDREIRADSITAVAATLRRLSGEEPAVVIERDEHRAADAPTLTRVPGHGQQRGPACCPPPCSPFPGPRPAVAMPYAVPQAVGPKSKVVAGVLGIILGGLGAHRFYLGYIGIGLLQLALTIVTGGLAAIWGFVEGIVCLCGGMRDADGLKLHD
ncbi:MAG TPA: TM2 domain-containing protein [Phycisphaerae bacterium]|nr:TM2 domain-containing protein [Phycisphaerae bacterium]